MEALDPDFMRHALAMARRAQGRTRPNPPVGCALVKDGQVIAAAHTAPGGRPHAETQALERAGERARGATAYVTLEPCAHHGQTPPCANALHEAGISRVVIGCEDPDARVSGKGAALLREAGIEVVTECREPEITAFYAGYFRRVRDGLPEITLKIATSLDGRIATANGESRWITGAAARRYGHALRARHDAVLTGIGTALADDPLLTCRLPGYESTQTLRILLDRQLRLPESAQLVVSAREHPLWLFCLPEALRSQEEKAKKLSRVGVELIALPESEADVGAQIDFVFRSLAARGVSSVLVEAGKLLGSAVLASGLASRLYWFRAPLVIGEGGLAAFSGENAALADLRRWKREALIPLGEDVLEIYTSLSERK